MPLLSYFHFSFTVSDLKCSIEFYRDKFGLKLVHRMIHNHPYTSQQIGTRLISATAIGSAANWDINPRWFPNFLVAPKILVRMDADQDGAGAAAQIASLS